MRRNITDGLGGVTLYGSNPLPMVGLIGGLTGTLLSDSSSKCLLISGTPSLSTTGPATPLVTPGGRLVILGARIDSEWVAALETAVCTWPRTRLSWAASLFDATSWDVLCDVYGKLTFDAELE